MGGLAKEKTLRNKTILRREGRNMINRWRQVEVTNVGKLVVIYCGGRELRSSLKKSPPVTAGDWALRLNLV